nr:response regulator transcription factor [Clostridioides difficile]
MFKIMVVEDDVSLKNIIAKCLTKWGHDVHQIENLENIIEEFKNYNPELVLLDINLPFYDGFHWCNEIRKISKVPIIFISSRNSNMDVIMGVNLGADDYITKPFSLMVLISKVNALMKRVNTVKNYTLLVCDDLFFYYIENKLIIRTDDKEEEIILSKTETKLLKYLMENSMQTLTKEQLLESLWDSSGNFVDNNTIAVNIRRLRQKVEKNPSEPKYIKTVRGVGYMWGERSIKKC